MNHEVNEQQGRRVVSFEGDVDLESSPSARGVLLEEVSGGNDVLVDLSRVTYIDSSGVASLVEAFQKARSQKTGFALASVSQPVHRVLQLARLDKVFTIHESIEDALAHDA